MPFNTQNFYKKPLFIIIAFLLIIGYIKYRQVKDPLKVFAYLLSREILIVTGLIILVLLIGQFVFILFKIL